MNPLHYSYNQQNSQKNFDKDFVKAIDKKLDRTNKELSYTPFEKAIKHHQHVSENLLNLAEMLSI